MRGVAESDKKERGWGVLSMTVGHEDRVLFGRTGQLSCVFVSLKDVPWSTRLHVSTHPRALSQGREKR